MRPPVIVFLFVSLAFTLSARSQSPQLIIQGQTGKLYLEHTVVAKENWYSIGRLFNISPREIAPFNNLTLENSLSIGQKLQIPLTAVNFSQNGQKAAGESLVPVYHILQPKEWLSKVSSEYNKVPVADLEKWNSINKDQVKSGTSLIVGYLKVKTALSALASGGSTAPVAVASPASSGSEGGQHIAASHEATGAVHEAGGAAVKEEKLPAKEERLPVKEEKLPAKEEAKNVVAMEKKTTAPVSVPAGSKPVENKPIENKPVAAPPTSTSQAPAPGTSSPVTLPAATPVAASGRTINFNGGFFKPEFSDGGKSASGVAGTFKSTSGWQDGKYYALMNNAPVGTIVKITATAGGKTVYAKVLGGLPEMKESAGLAIRLSNAAAAELGQGDGRFNVETRY